MTATRDPLAGVTRILVDGTNLLHALHRGPSGLGPATAIVARLRGAFPPAVRIDLVFDGPPDKGLPDGRVATGVHVRHGWRHSADDVMVGIVDGIRAGDGTTDHVLAVTDDRELRFALRARGARTARLAWVVARMGRRTTASPGIANRRPPLPAEPAPGSAAAATAAEGNEKPGGWRPGRGATTKRGNPRRAPKRDRA